MNASVDDDEEQPLDPAAARIQQKLRRLILISGLTLGIGMIAVFSAILYRVVKSEPDGAGAAKPVYASGELLVPKGSTVVSSSKDGDFLTVTIRTEAGSEVRVIDLRTRAVVSRIRFVPESE